jgi:hypothetical protein
MVRFQQGLASAHLSVKIPPNLEVDNPAECLFHHETIAWPTATQGKWAVVNLSTGKHSDAIVPGRLWTRGVCLTNKYLVCDTIER